MKIVFIGTSEFGAIILEGLINLKFKPTLVITIPDKPVGRQQILTPPPVKVVAEKYSIPVLQPEKIENCKSEIENLKPELIIVAAYGQILPKDILDIPKYGTLGIHPSLLPKYRGPSPIQYAILNGEKETGVTIILMDEKIDHGPIIAQCSAKIEEKETAKSLHDKLANLAISLLLNTILKLQQGLIIPKSQNEREAIFTKILVKSDGKINWRKTAQDLEREIRAFNMWPGSFTFWEKDDKILRIKVLKADVYSKPGHLLNYPVGKTLILSKNEIGVQCGKDILIIEKLQLEGKKETLTTDFIKGHPDFIGTILK